MNGAQDELDATKRGLDGAARLTVFVGGPFSAALRLENGEVAHFDPGTRHALDRVHALFAFNGFGLLSSHLAEDFGRSINEKTLVQRDNAWLRASDLYVAVLPWGADGPARSDGTFIEVGLALGLGVPCVLLIDRAEDPAWSYYVRNLKSEEDILVLPLESDDQVIMEKVREYLDFRLGHTLFRQRSPKPLNIDVVHALAAGGKAGHTVVTPDYSLDAPANSLTSRYCIALDALFDEIDQIENRPNVIELGSGIGEATIRLGRHASSIAVFEPDAALAEACRGNLELSPAGAPIAWIEGREIAARASEANLIVAQFPPWPDGGDPFADRREPLVRALEATVKEARSGTPIWISVCVPFNADRARDALASLGIEFCLLAVRGVGLLKGVIR